MTIELGQISETRPAAPPAPRLPARGPRLAVLLLLLLALLGGEQPVDTTVAQLLLPPLAGGQEPVIVGGPAGPGGATEHLLLTPELAGPTGSQLTARRLPGLEPVWQAPLSFDVVENGFWAVAADGVVLVGWYSRDGGADQPETLALDRADGTVRWRRAGWMYGYGRSGPVLLHDERTGNVQSVDPGSGRVRWSARIPEEAWPTVYDIGGSVPAVWVVIDRTGLLEVRDLSSNRLLASREVAAESGPSSWFAGDVLLYGGGQRTTAYGLPDLEPRWALDWRVDQQSHAFHVTGCGAMPCLVGDADGLRALDPRTGAVRWSSPRWRFAHPLGEHVLLFESPLSSSNWTGTAYVADPGTGQVLGDFGSWTLLGRINDSAPLIGTRRLSGGRLLLAVLHPEGAEVFAIVDETSDGCTWQPGVIVCQRTDGSQVLLMVPGRIG